MKNKIASVGLAILMAVSLCACGTTPATASDIDNALQKIEQMQSQITELQDKLSVAEDKLAETERKNYETTLLLKRQMENLFSEEITYSASAPVYDISTQGIELYNKYSENKTNSECFNEFVQSFNSDIMPKTDEKFVLFDPLYDEYSESCHSYYSVVAEKVENGKYKNLMVVENFFVSVPTLGEFENPKDSENWEPRHLELFFCMAPVDDLIYENKDFWIKFEYGDWSDNNILTYENGGKYCNLYSYGRCIGTCYFSVYGHLSQYWIERFIRKSCVRG